MAVAHERRRLSAGVEMSGDGVASARVWAPSCRTVEVVVDRPGREQLIVAMTPETDGYYSASLTGVRPGDRYWYQLDGSRRRPDPVSRFQPEGPHGPSAIVDASQFQWTDSHWYGVTPHGQVLYELHIGTFTPEGTWASAAARLEQLAEIGVTIIEMMPVADFPGRWGWGYDGVNLYAPTRLYGSPDDLRRFVDRAHTLGLGVILDVVYNHLGPDGNYLGDYSADYFTDKYSNDWGRSLNFEGPEPARHFFAENGAYWIEEFHFDGLRLDATQDVHDASSQHVLAEIVQRARRAGGSRRLFFVAENEPQHTKLVRDPASGGYGIDALLNDDFHHAALVALTGRREAYYMDYKGSPQELISCVKFGYLYQGQWYSWQNQRRGTPGLDLPATAFVHFLENHDQVANTSLGKRVHQLSSPGRSRALTALTLLGPATPLLFQGQEFAASAPFLFFVDHCDELREGIRTGRREFLSQFPSLHDAAQEHRLPDPDDPATFERSRLDWNERDTHAEAVALHRDLLAIRRQDSTIAGAARGDAKIDGAVLSPHVFVLRFSATGGDDRLLFVNLGADLDLSPLPEPLLAPPLGRLWVEQWNSDATTYGGPGRKPLQSQPSWWLSAESAVLLRADAEEAPGTHA